MCLYDGITLYPRIQVAFLSFLFYSSGCVLIFLETTRYTRAQRYAKPGAMSKTFASDSDRRTIPKGTNLYQLEWNERCYSGTSTLTMYTNTIFFLRIVILIARWHNVLPVSFLCAEIDPSGHQTWARLLANSWRFSDLNRARFGPLHSE
jgi:hypothetical protein